MPEHAKTTLEPSWPADSVERRALTTLVPAARNARTHTDVQVAQIAASIREWGWTVPVVIDERAVLSRDTDACALPSCWGLVRCRWSSLAAGRTHKSAGT